MKLIDINWRPTDRQLRQFGLICIAGLPVLGWVFSSHHPTITAAAAVAGAVCGLLGWLKPQLLKPLFIGLTVVTFPIGLLVSELIVGLMFVFLFTPVALAFKLMGRDALQRRFDRQRKTYWEPHPASVPAHRYFQQY